jgi:hypothetical protein
MAGSRRLRLFLVLALVAIVVPASLLAASGLIGKDTKSEHWGVIYRNTEGSPVAELRNGPYGTFHNAGSPVAEPPFGKGSVGIVVANGTEKVDFGNEVDFVGDPVLALSQTGFYVFQPGENGSSMPVIRYEIDAALNALPADHYTTMVFVPNPVSSFNQWSGYIDATLSTTGFWYFTGAEGGATGCTQATQCTFSQAMSQLNDGGAAPIFYSISVGKGKDSRWAGAIDGLRINDWIYDFEADGVKKKDAK